MASRNCLTNSLRPQPSSEREPHVRDPARSARKQTDRLLPGAAGLTRRQRLAAIPSSTPGQMLNDASPTLDSRRSSMVLDGCRAALLGVRIRVSTLRLPRVSTRPHHRDGATGLLRRRLKCRNSASAPVSVSSPSQEEDSEAQTLKRPHATCCRGWLLLPRRPGAQQRRPTLPECLRQTCSPDRPAIQTGLRQARCQSAARN